MTDGYAEEKKALDEAQIGPAEGQTEPPQEDEKGE